MEGIWNYLTYRSVPSPATLLEDIIKVRPGQCLTFSEKGLRAWSYWDIPLHAAARRSAEWPQATNNATRRWSPA